MKWAAIKGYETRYEVSDCGDIRKINGEIIRQYKNSNGYLLARLSGPRKEVRVHRVVAEAFILNPKNLPFVNHIDCTRSNNSVENLEWCTQWENLNHSQKLGRMQRNYWVGKRSPNAKLNDTQISDIRSEYKKGGISWQSLAKKYNTNKRSIGRIVNGESYV